LMMRRMRGEGQLRNHWGYANEQTSASCLFSLTRENEKLWVWVEKCFGLLNEFWMCNFYGFTSKFFQHSIEWNVDENVFNFYAWIKILKMKLVSKNLNYNLNKFLKLNLRFFFKNIIKLFT
jgi:hypothetical protein